MITALDELARYGIHIDTRGPLFTVNFGSWAKGNFYTMLEAIDFAFLTVRVKD